MLPLTKYSLNNLSHQYSANAEVIQSYLTGGNKHSSDSKVAGLAISLFLLIFAIAIAIFIWSVYALIKYAKYMPEWAVVLSAVFLFMGGSVFTLVLVYATKNDM